MLRHLGQHSIGRGGRVDLWTGATAGVIDGDEGNAFVFVSTGTVINGCGGGDGCDASIILLGELTLVCTWEELDASSALYFKVSSFSCTLDFL